MAAANGAGTTPPCAAGAPGSKASVMPPMTPTDEDDAARSPLGTIEEAIAEYRAGRMVIVMDDEDRENEGDLIFAADFVTPEKVNFLAKHGRGLICVPTTGERLQQLGIAEMVARNRESFKTDFQVSVDAASGISTGISAAISSAVNPVKSRSNPRSPISPNSNASISLSHPAFSASLLSAST